MKQEVKEKIEEILSKWENVEWIEKDYVIRNTQRYLKETDYIIIKIQEYTMLGKEVDNDYTEVMQEREYCREILRKLEV